MTNTMVKLYKFRIIIVSVILSVTFLLLNTATLLNKSLMPLYVSILIILLTMPVYVICIKKLIFYKKAKLEFIQDVTLYTAYNGYHKGTVYLNIEMIIDGQKALVSTEPIFTATKGLKGLHYKDYLNCKLKVGYFRQNNIAIVIKKYNY